MEGGHSRENRGDRNYWRENKESYELSDCNKAGKIKIPKKKQKKKNNEEEIQPPGEHRVVVDGNPKYWRHSQDNLCTSTPYIRT
jgi:hypothetical protein